MNKKGFILSFFICLFSFCFIGSVKAYVRPTIQNKSITDIDFTYNGVRYNYDKLSTDLNYALSQSGLSLNDFTSFIMVVPTVPKTTDWPQYIVLYLFNTNITSYQLGSSPENDGRIYFEPNLTYSWSITWRFKQKDYFYGGTSFNTSFWDERIHTGSSTSNTYEIYSNTDWFNIPNLTANAEYDQYTILNVDNSLFYNPLPATFNIHLNGGYCYDDFSDFGSDADFSITLYENELNSFFMGLQFKKYNMIYDGLYTDSNFTHRWDISDTSIFNGGTVDLYAKYRYENASDFLNNTSFNNYTFDINYDYAIINRGDNSDSVYIGLPFSSYDLEIYEYDESNNIVKNGSSACLVPIFSYNNYYYYDLNTLYTSNQEILLLPKTTFNVDNYNFFLTSNAYISYTNNLSSSVIVDSNGNNISIDLQESFNTSRFYLESYSESNSLDSLKVKFKSSFNRFLNPIKFIFRNVTNLYNNYINTSMQHYFFLVFSLMIIVLIIRVIF